IRRYLSVDNIYTLKLTRRGHHIPMSLHSHMFMVRRADDVMRSDIIRLPGTTTLKELDEQDLLYDKPGYVVVTRNERILGLIDVDATLRAVREADPELTLAQLAHHDFTVVRAGMVMFDVLNRMGSKGVRVALVVRPVAGVPRANDVLGLITETEIAESVSDSLTFRSASGSS
ncbi:MAG TPA: CBS domain-containing protein, partial [Chromatiales bacterium]|nr:CBS domain-containing protein [Chromatiales bacterium]